MRHVFRCLSRWYSVRLRFWFECGKAFVEFGAGCCKPFSDFGSHITYSTFYTLSSGRSCSRHIAKNFLARLKIRIDPRSVFAEGRTDVLTQILERKLVCFIERSSIGLKALSDLIFRCTHGISGSSQPLSDGGEQPFLGGFFRSSSGGIVYDTSFISAQQIIRDTCDFSSYRCFTSRSAGSESFIGSSCNLTGHSFSSDTENIISNTTESSQNSILNNLFSGTDNRSSYATDKRCTGGSAGHDVYKSCTSSLQIGLSLRDFGSSMRIGIPCYSNVIGNTEGPFAEFPGNVACTTNQCQGSNRWS